MEEAGVGEAGEGFDPQALTSLTTNDTIYEVKTYSFDPQALTSLTLWRASALHKF